MKPTQGESKPKELEGQDLDNLDLNTEDFVFEDKKRRQDVLLDKLSEYLMAKYTFKTLRDTEEILVYDASRGVYRANGETVIKEAMEEVLKERGLVEQATRRAVSEVVGHIQRQTCIEREEVNAKSRFINVQSGLLDLKKALHGEPDALELHTNQVVSTIQLPVKYDPKATCPRISKFFREVVAEKDVPLLEEIFGWCLLPDYRFQRAVLLSGEGSNGKSTLINLVKALLGSENCSAVSLQAASPSNNRFATANLYGKLANLCADLSSATISDAGALKMLTGGDLIPAEHKFGKPFTFTNRAKLIFSANRPPQIHDDSLAVWRRVMIIDFPNQFMGKEDDKGLLGKITTQSELSGLLNVAITGLRRLARKKDFSYGRSWEETKENYIMLSDPLQAFVEECCVLGVTEGNLEEGPPAIPKEKLYKHYVVYCQVNKLPPDSKKGFGRHLKAKYKREVSERKAGWVGIAIKD